MPGTCGRVCFALFIVLIVSSTFPTAASAGPFQIPQAQPSGPKIWLGESRPVPVKQTGALVSLSRTGQGTGPEPQSLAAGDVDGDGIADLIAGYSTSGGGFVTVQRGNLDAFAPQSSASLLATGRGQFPSPFLAEARNFPVPVSPDFLVTGDFSGSGHLDVALAARGGNTVYLLAGDGKGNFAAPQPLSLPGAVTALATGTLGRTEISSLLIGLSDPQTGFSLHVYSGTAQHFGEITSFSLPSAVSNILFGDFGDAGDDAAFLSGGDVVVLHASSMQLEQLSLPVSASSMALGSFIYDRKPHIQIALLASDGSIHIAAHSEFDPHTLSVDEMRTIRQAVRNGEPNPLVPQRSVAVNGWKIVETIPGAAPSSSGQPPIFFRTRISDHGADDLMILNPSLGQLAVVSHPDAPPDTPTFSGAQISTLPYIGSPVAALPMRTNIDGRPGVVALHAGQMSPMVMMPLPDPTFVVNTTNDTVDANLADGICADSNGQCSLRAAVQQANATAGTDTIMVPAGTFTLTLPKVANDCTASHGALYINDSVNIVGAGQNATIIQAGTTSSNGVDFVMAVNEDLATAACPNTNATASISNLTLRFGRNLGAHGFDGDGGCMEFDTGTSGNANLTLTNVTLDTCSTTKGNGAGIAIFNFITPGPGMVTFSNSIIQNNSAVDSTSGVGAGGGGIWVSQASRMSMTNSQVLNNKATQVNGTGLGIGGGIFIFNNTSNSRQTVIHNSTISGNKSAGFGGGIWSTANLLIDQSSVISGNTAGTDGTNPIAGQSGGGLFLNTSSNGCPSACTDSTTLTQISITGNTATGNGGGIATGNNSGAGNLTMHFSRLAGNTATAGSNNLDNNSTTALVTDNWWGTVTPANTIHNTNGAVSANTTFDPYINLTHTASPSPIRINQSTTLTADISKDNHGTTVTNLTEVIGLPVTFNNAVLGTIPNAQPETIGSTATATATFNAGGTSGLGKADATVDQAVVTATFPVLEPLRIVKSFGAAVIPVNGVTTVNFAVTNPNVVAVDANFTDTFPGTLVVAATPGASNTCGGTVTAVAGSSSVSFSNASLAVGACSISVNVTASVDNLLSNSVTINSTAAGTGALSTSTANLTVINPPHIAKVFAPQSIPLNGTSTLTFTLNSTNVNLTLNGIAFTDSLPAGLLVAPTPNLNSTCSGTATALAGSSSISLSAASLAPGASCTVTVDVQGTAAGVLTNSVQASSTNAGTGNTANATITVVGPPVITKLFGARSIPLNGSTSLSFTIQNNNTTTTLTGVGFTDTLPAGLVISNPNALTGTCGGGTITATADSSVISLSGASLAASNSCTFSVNVKGAAAGAQDNTTSNVTSVEGGTGNAASDTLKVEAPPSINKVFAPTTIPLNGTTTLTFTITNPAANVDPLTGVAFTDTLPTGLTVATAAPATTCGGTLTVTAPTSISLSGATIAVNGQCVFTVTVTGAASGQYTNTTGAVTSTNGGTGNTASANLTVASAPTIQKAFGALTIPLNGTTSLTFTIQNPNTGVTLTGLAFTDSLPAGLLVAPTPNLNNTCGGTATAVAGSSSISLSAGTVAASTSCTVSVNVQGVTAGTVTNSVQVTSTEGGSSTTASATITVVAPPAITKLFGARSIPLNGSTSLSFTIQNSNATTALTGVGFTDTLPAGLLISSPNGQSGTCGGGTITATAGTSVISLSGASLAASSSCTFLVSVTGTAAGAQINTSSNVTSVEGGTGNAASDTLKVEAPPSINKVFNPANIPLNGTTSLTFTITNPAANVDPLTGVAFTDTLPAGLTVANASAPVCGGTLTTTAPTGIALSGATINTNSQCVFLVTVTGAVAGQYTNTTGAVTSTNGGTGNTASANLTVATPPSINKTFGALSILLNASTTLTFNINNPNTTLGLTGIAFSDTLPAGLVVSTPNGLSSNCGGTVTATAGSGSISLSGGSVAANASCSITLNVTGITAGVQNNTTGPISSNESGAGSPSNTATITVIGPPSIAKAFGAASINLNATTTLTFTITNPNPTVPLNGVAFGDTLPGGLVVANPNGLTGSCGAGTITTGTVSGLSVVNLAGGDIAAGGSCTFSVNVVGTTAGHKVNTTGTVTSTNAGSGNTAGASIDVLAPDPAIMKTHTGTFKRGQTGAQYTITVTNAGFGPTVGTITVVDILPNVQHTLVPTDISGTGWTCTLATLTCVRADPLPTGGSYPVITLTVNIPTNIQNPFTNTATVSGGGDVNPNNNTATDFVNLGPPIVMTPKSTSVAVTAGGTAAMSINVDTPDPTVGNITFSCSGLPSASTCNFNPGSIDPAATPGPTTLTVSIFTTKGTASLVAPPRPGRAGRTPIYAMLSLPVFGVMLAGFSGQRRRSAARWMGLTMVGLLLLLAMAGCGVAPPPPPPTPGTPAGTFPLTITATSSGFTATTTFNLVVQ